MRRNIVGLFAVVAVTGAFFVAPAGATTSSAPWGYTGATHASPRPMPFAPTAQVAPAGSHLTYNGGPVISNVSVESVYWGTGTFAPGVRSALAPCPAQSPCTPDEYFQGLTDSPYFDWLSEYKTPSQSIGRGQFRGRTTITPSALNSGPTISEEMIADELSTQLASGALPAPEVDAAGQVKTLYAMFFPQTVTLTLGSAVGGEQGGFCAYHSTTITLDNGLAVPFMVLPDFESHHFSVDGACGDVGMTLFDKFMAVTSHELIESVTDPAVGLFDGLAWYDNTNGEIADICQSSDEDRTIAGGNGLTLTVQQEFSNAANDCIVTRGAASAVRDGYVNACRLAGRTGFADAGYAADCLKAYAISQGKNDGTFGENDGLVRSQVSSLLARLVEQSGVTLSGTRPFADVTADSVPNAQVRSEIELLAGSGIIAGYPDGLFHPTDNLSVAQAVALVTRTLQVIHEHNPNAPDVIDQGSTAADYETATGTGLLDTSCADAAGFPYSSGVGDRTDRGLLADVLAQAIQRLVDTHAMTAV